MPEASQAQEWVEVASYTSLLEAEAAASALEAAEIDVDLRDAAAVGALPLMSQSFGGVGLCVPAADAERAREVLTSLAVPAPDAASTPEDGAAELERPEENDRTQLARRAWLAAALGLFLMPVVLHVLSIWNLVRLARTPGPMSKRAWRMTVGALVVNALVLAGAGLYVASLAAMMSRRPPPIRIQVIRLDDLLPDGARPASDPAGGAPAR